MRLAQFAAPHASTPPQQTTTPAKTAKGLRHPHLEQERQRQNPFPVAPPDHRWTQANEPERLPRLQGPLRHTPTPPRLTGVPDTSLNTCRAAKTPRQAQPLPSAAAT